MRFAQLIIRTLAGVFIMMLALSGAGMVQAAECKGLEQQKCVSEAKCSWVRSYKTSKGTEVKAFCRRKPVRRQTTQAVPVQPNGT